MTALDAVARLLYVLGAAVVLGGTAALSFAAAPQTFRALPPAQAGRVFGKTLAVFDRIGAIAAVVAVVGAVLALFSAVTFAGVSRLVLAACMRLVFLVLRRFVAPAMERTRPSEASGAAEGGVAEAKARFDALHAIYVRLYAANLLLSLAGLSLAALLP